MLRKILSLVLNFEKIFTKKKHRQVAESKGATGEGRTKKFVSSIHAVSIKETIPDPWFN
jgi:hypothetical protein